MLSFSTYLGGNGKDTGDGVAVDPTTRDVFICGASGSTDLPRAHVLNSTIGGDNDAFVARLDASGGRLVYDDLIGGNDIDEAYAIAVDGARNAYIAGYTAPPNYATTPRAAQTRYGGGPRDAFVAKVNAPAAPSSTTRCSAETTTRSPARSRSTAPATRTSWATRPAAPSPPRATACSAGTAAAATTPSWPSLPPRAAACATVPCSAAATTRAATASRWTGWAPST